MPALPNGEIGCLSLSSALEKRWRFWTRGPCRTGLAAVLIDFLASLGWSSTQEGRSALVLARDLQPCAPWRNVEATCGNIYCMILHVSYKDLCYTMLYYTY